MRLKTFQVIADVHVYHFNKQCPKEEEEDGDDDEIHQHFSDVYLFIHYMHEIMNNLTVVIISKQI